MFYLRRKRNTVKKLLLHTIRIRGVRSANASFQCKIWLNNTLLKMDKSLKIKSHSLRGFGWGNDEKGGLQFALAICMEIYPVELVKRIYHDFYKAFLVGIQEDGFDLTVDLEGFNREFVEEWL
jgi:hypothetical protein